MCTLWVCMNLLYWQWLLVYISVRESVTQSQHFKDSQHFKETKSTHAHTLPHHVSILDLNFCSETSGAFFSCPDWETTVSAQKGTIKPLNSTWALSDRVGDYVQISDSLLLASWAWNTQTRRVRTLPLPFSVPHVMSLRPLIQPELHLPTDDPRESRVSLVNFIVHCSTTIRRWVLL